jgi:hypothetical protein
VLTSWAEKLGGRAEKRARGVLRFAFYGRVSTEDWQDPVMPRARQWEQAEALVRGHGRIVAEFFDVGQTRKLAWACRPQAAALVARLAEPDRGWDAIVIGEYERAFYGSQYAAMARCSSTTMSSCGCPRPEAGSITSPSMTRRR